MKKWMLQGSLATVLASSLLLAGCGANNQQANSTPPAQSTPATQNQAEEPAAELPKGDVELTLSAAASLTDALQEIEQQYKATHPHVTLRFNFGASGSLQQQIEQGAPADLFLSAASKNMEALVEKGLIDASQRTALLNNELVVVTAKDAAFSLDGLEDLKLADIRTLAIGIPESVPAGNYAKEALTAANLWDDLTPKTVQAKDVRQVLQYVETGNAEAGFVYKTDALSTDQVDIAFAVDAALYPAVTYPIGIIKDTDHPDEAEALYTYLQTDEALGIFERYGFSIPASR
ncbi:molybdate ABC transporter substrate-binding protein [Paenibacillus sp. 598K]|uniref:molybdate ABC transporter substrate-binding protein n=1 Tax=Paenibacillus sp. 598K TaxID=1117987 RepID=UPI000FFF5F69|nr:molybdate ABC transporter substrate-binding protein [Paenibacillus sp. 598K]